jgi:hypothetical protein
VYNAGWQYTFSVIFEDPWDTFRHVIDFKPLPLANAMPFSGT